MDKTTHGTCRCCLIKGHHKDLMKEYYVNGNREVYLDIFMDCYNLYVSHYCYYHIIGSVYRKRCIGLLFSLCSEVIHREA